MVNLASEASAIVIEIITSVACREERIFLSHNGIRSCEPLSFCLDDPTIDLAHRNVSSGRAVAIQQQTGLFDPIITSFTAFGSQFQQVIYYFIGIIAAFFLFSLVIILLKR